MITHLASRQNPRVKGLVQLRRGAQRQAAQLVIDGAREVFQARAAGIDVLEAYGCLELHNSDETQRVWSALAADGVAMYSVSRPVYEKIRFGERSDGLLVVANRPRRRLSDMRLAERPLVAVIDGLEKPGNVGAILRSADGAGVDATAVVGSADLFHPQVIRNSMGCVFGPHVAVASHEEVVAWLAEQGLSVVAASPDAKMEYWHADLSGRVALLLGSEAHGLSSAWDKVPATHVVIPMCGRADSLNVSAAAACLFYEALRQRRARPG